MKKNINVSLCLFFVFAFSSCSKDIVDLTGSIHGVIKDYNTGAMLSNCQVSLMPGGKSALTGSEGMFAFNNLEQGSYTLSITRAGYEEASRTVSVVSGETTEVNMTLKAKSAFAASSNVLNFGDLSSSMELYFFNNSDESCTFTISSIPSWVSFSQTTGSVPSGSNTALSVSVNRDAVDYGTYTQIVTVSYKGKMSGSIHITIQMQKIQLTTPTVTIGDAAENITQNVFTVSGELTATGGAIITNYGHCWSLTPNPTIDDYKTDNGATTDLVSFRSEITGLTPGTSYYVRAYATNRYGTSYSTQIAVTTQDVPSNKWDGNIAESFAGGSGTDIDPYIIETGGQLLLMKEYNYGCCFELANNIDLDNKNWLPFDFKGTLDGKGYTISNLYVSRSMDGQGLFSTLGGSYNNGLVKNLTIKNVNIVASSNSYIGPLAGIVADYAQIINCHVILTEKSKILGSSNVGGLAGGTPSRDDVSIVDCSVDYSGTATDVIKGNNNVGGLIGFLDGCSYKGPHTQYITENVRSCSVSANITGISCIGGVIGKFSDYLSAKSDIYNCSFNGTLTGESNVGGIIGYSEFGGAIASRANVDLTATKGYAGGIIGNLRPINGGIYADYIVACYSTGKISGSSSSSNMTSCGGLIGGNSYNYITSKNYVGLILSYSTINSSLSGFDGISGMGYGFENAINCASTSSTRFTGTNKGSCNDITTFMRECYSEYADYWNFNNTWVWNGKVSCPRLSWE